MTDQETSKLDRELAGWRLALRLITLLFILLMGFVALSATYGSARFESIFAEMLGGKSLPILTRFVLTQRGIITLLFLLLTISGSVGILLLKNRGALLCIGIGTVLLLTFGTLAILAACFIPLVSVVTEMSG